jgi:hypothetical protein
MSDNKPTPTENQEADTFVGRLSVVVMCLASIVSGMSSIVLTQPDVSSTRQSFWDDVLKVCVLGWPAYLSVIYLFGRFKEASKRCYSLGQGKGGNFYELSLIPFCVGLFVAAISWLGWRLPDGIRWVAALFGR